MSPVLINPYRFAVAGGGGGFYVPLTVDHTQCGASDSTGMPVLVDITNANFKTVANGGHVDNTAGVNSIRFYSDSGLTTLLKFEREAYDATTGHIRMWVKVTTTHSSDLVFYMKYGAPGDTGDVSDANNTWANYVRVYHLGDGSTVGLVDSTANADTLTNSGATAVTGQIYGGASSTGSPNEMAGASTTNLAIASGWTVEAWVKSTGGSGFRGILCRGDSNVRNYELDFDASNKLRAVFTEGSGNFKVANGATATTTNTIAHVAGIYTGALLSAYLNGVSDGSTSVSGSADTGGGMGSLHLFQIPGASSFWVGWLDEVRVSSVARSADFMLTNYNTMKNPGTFITVGGEVAL